MPSLEHATAGDAMRPRVLTCTPETPLVTVEHATTHAVVVDGRTRRPVGVVSTLDIAGIVGWGRA